MGRKFIGLLLTWFLLIGAGFSLASREVFYYHTDHLGSVRMVTDRQGGVVRVHDYLLYGEEVTPAADRDVFGFTGQRRDTETGLDYFGARYYASRLGRFMIPDALFADQHPADPQSWNLYSYVANNPLRFIDTNGRVKLDAAGNVIFDKTGSGAVTFIAALPMGGGRTFSVTWNADFGKIYADDGTAIEASKATSDIKITVRASGGSIIAEGGPDLVPGWSGYSCTADCHGVTFAKGQVWINNDQVEKLVKGDNYKEVKRSAPKPGDVGIYSTDGKLKTAVHSVRAEKVNRDGKVTKVISKGGITPKVSVAPGPGPGTGWNDASAKLRYYRKEEPRKEKEE